MYQKGKIYTIRSHHTDKVYVGSTVVTLCKRIAQHRLNYRNYLNGTYSYVTSFKILEYGDAYIELHEDYPCDRKEELHRREGEIIREFKEKCINRCIAGRTNKEWCEDNQHKIKEKQKEYYEINKQQLNERQKEYYKKNQEQIAEKKKEYYEENKQQISEKQKEKMTCECGSNVTKRSIKRHERTLKHLNFINSKNIE